MLLLRQEARAAEPADGDVDARLRFYQLLAWMGFGTPFAQKPRKAEPHKPVTGTLVRILLLAVAATFCAAYGIYLYYTHAFRPKPAPARVDAGQEVEIEIR